MEKILVTGASGFIGKHLVARLRAVGHEVVETRRSTGDVADEATWKSYPAADVVVHLAGRSFVPESWTNPELFFQSNLLGTVAALNWCKRHSGRLVFLSSYLYGNPQRLPIGEDAPLYATNPYALSKLMAEEAARFYAENFRVPVTVFRPFNVYGSGQSEKFLIPSIIKQVSAGNGIRVKDLEPRRDYVHVLDLVDAIVLALGERRGFSVFNIGSGSSHSVADVIANIQQVWKTQHPVVSDNERRPGEIRDTVADVSAASRDLNWAPRFSLLDGLHEIHEAMRR
jgi:nucleoside-diphosphate-sugar epimerase